MREEHGARPRGRRAETPKKTPERPQDPAPGLRGQSPDRAASPRSPRQALSSGPGRRLRDGAGRGDSRESPRQGTESPRREAWEPARPAHPRPSQRTPGRGWRREAGQGAPAPSSARRCAGPGSPRSRAPEAALAGRPGGRKRLGPHRPAPRSRVQGSAVFRLPSDLTLSAQRPPGCAALAQASSRCQINEPTSGWVYSSAGKQPSGK